jgi:hypothetical protein
MADEQKPKIEKIENLELNRETIQDLTGEEAEAAEGAGIRSGNSLCPGMICNSAAPTCATCVTCSPGCGVLTAGCGLKP